MDSNFQFTSPLIKKSLRKHDRSGKEKSLLKSQMKFQFEYQGELPSIKKSPSAGLSQSQKKLRTKSREDSQYSSQIDDQFKVNLEFQGYESCLVRRPREEDEKIKNFSRVSEKDESSSAIKTKTIGTQYEIPFEHEYLDVQEQEEKLPSYEQYVERTNKNFKLLFEKIQMLQKLGGKQIGTTFGDRKTRQNGKKNRRKAADINRKYKCGLGGCSKRYGSRSSVKVHIKKTHNIQKNRIKIVNNAARIVELEEFSEAEISQSQSLMN